jgi:hypothetical protein
MSKKGLTIAIREQPGLKPRKLTKVISYGADGFGALVPYHRAHSGFVAKVPMDYRRVGEFSVPEDEIVGFTSEHRVKLSSHADGFAQFSGEVQGKVISGRDPVTGEPKGVGLMTQPLSNPIQTGPSFGVTAWGLSDFEELEEPVQTAIVFEHTDVYFRGCTPRTANGWVLEVFVFPARYWAATRKTADGYSMAMSFRDFEASAAVIEMKVIDLVELGVLLAGFVSRVAVSFETQSGWVLKRSRQRRP